MRIATVDNFEMTSSVETALGEVMAALKDGDSNVRCVGVHGLPGVGKTTVVKRAAAKALEEKLFERVVFSTVSASVDLEKIQKEVAECLGISLAADHIADMRAGVIKRKIMELKKVLIVLDDVWKKLELSEVGIPIKSELLECSSKMVLTTRIEQVCFDMGCQEKIGLGIWSDPESREFLKKTAGTDFEVSSDFQKIANSVADECKGLPLALNAAARALGDKPVAEWKRALERLQQSKPPNPDYDDSVSAIIKLSYDYLNPDAKACFLLCCLFPEDFSIDREELARYAFGLGVFPEASSIEEARGDTATIAEKLKDSGLLLPAGDRVKMHDVMRDVAIQIASSSSEETIIIGGEKQRQVFFVRARKTDRPVDWPSEHTSKTCTAISVVSSGLQKLPENLDCPELKTLLLQDNTQLTEISSAFFKKNNSLRVLNMSRTGASLLPQSIEGLKMLRTLHIDNCIFDDISYLGVLENLAILSFRQSNIIAHLPAVLGKLKKLRMLDLTSCQNIKRIPPNVLSNMSSLEELYLKASFAGWHDGTNPEMSQNASFLEVVSLDRLTILEVDIEDAKSLRNLNVQVAPKWSKFDICICSDDMTRWRNIQPSTSGVVYTKNLLLDTSIKDFPDWFFKAVSMKIEKVTYAGSTKVNLFKEQANGRLVNLKSLILNQYTGVDYLIWGVPDSRPVLQSLEELQIYDTTIMEICNGDLPEGSFQSLESLTIHCCNKMGTTVLSHNFIERANNLRTVSVNNADAKEVFDVRENLDQGQRYLGKLREMRLENLYELEAAWKGPARFADFSHLKLVSVIKCEKLTNIFSVNILNRLSKLEDLWVEDCEKMKAIVGDRDEEITPQTVTLSLPNLKTLCLSNLPRLTNFCSPNLNLECPVLEYVHIHKCIDFPTTYFNSSKEMHKNNDQHMKTLKKRMTQEYF